MIIQEEKQLQKELPSHDCQELTVMQHDHAHPAPCDYHSSETVFSYSQMISYSALVSFYVQVYSSSRGFTII